MITTDLWVFSGKQGRMVRLAHVPDSGSFHRFVVEAGNLSWTENVALRSGRDTVRFIDGYVYGPWSPGVGAEEGAQSSYEATLDVTYKPMNGRFVEVVALGKDGADARSRALALLGHINLILGPNAYGPVVIDAEIDARFGHSQSYTLLTENQLRFQVSVDDFALDTGLSEIDVLSRLDSQSRAIVALERYAQATSTTLEELRFAAFVSGIDAVVSDFYGEHKGGDLGKKRREEADRLVAERLQGIDKGTIDRIRDRLVSPSFLDKFTFYVNKNGLDQSLVEEFAFVRPRRNDLFHGGRSADLASGTASAKRILEAIICKEVGIDKQKVWRLARRFRTSGQFVFPNYGW
jgi:hypothetical protein